MMNISIINVLPLRLDAEYKALFTITFQGSPFQCKWSWMFKENIRTDLTINYYTLCNNAP